MRHLPFSLHHFDFSFLVKPARCFMKVPLPLMRKLPSNSAVLPGPINVLQNEAALVKGICWVTLIQNHLKEVRSYAPQIFQSLAVVPAFSIPASGHFLLLASGGAGQRTRASSQIWCLPLTFWQCFLTSNSSFSYFSQPHPCLVFSSQQPLCHILCVSLRSFAPSVYLLILVGKTGNGKNWSSA